MDSMDNFRERFEALEQRTEQLQQHTRMVERRLRWWRGIACGVGLLALVSMPLQSGTAADTQPARMGERIATLENKLSAMTFDAAANEVVITGANLRIVNGLGRTDCTDVQGNPIPNCPNGLGNLIVGYNESRQEFPFCNPGQTCTDTRTGSHNVVGGKQHNFSSFGGLVVALFNEISGEFASVSGGAFNTASGFQSSISGGNDNTASALGASISGGGSNTVTGVDSWIGGGLRNTAGMGVLSSVSGGAFNTASGQGVSICGGNSNTARGGNSSVSGGQNNTASGAFSSVSGGENNTANGNSSSVSGGANRSAPAQDNWAAGALFSDN